MASLLREGLDVHSATALRRTLARVDGAAGRLLGTAGGERDVVHAAEEYLRAREEHLKVIAALPEGADTAPLPEP